MVLYPGNDSQEVRPGLEVKNYIMKNYLIRQFIGIVIAIIILMAVIKEIFNPESSHVVLHLYVGAAVVGFALISLIYMTIKGYNRMKKND